LDVVVTSQTARVFFKLKNKKLEITK